MGFPVGFGIFPLYPPLLVHRGQGVLLQFRVIPHSRPVIGVYGGFGTLDLQLIHLAVGSVFRITVAAFDRTGRHIFRCKLCFVGGFGSHIFMLYLPDFVMYRQISGAASFERAFGRRIFLPPWPYLLLKMQSRADFTSRGIKFPLYPWAVLLGYFCLGFL